MRRRLADGGEPWPLVLRVFFFVFFWGFRVESVFIYIYIYIYFFFFFFFWGGGVWGLELRLCLYLLVLLERGLQSPFYHEAVFLLHFRAGPLGTI